MGPIIRQVGIDISVEISAGFDFLLPASHSVNGRKIEGEAK